MLDFRMYTFITLSHTLNYTKAAQQLNITQPAVTQHIKYLEAYYNVKLFHNAHKQLALTTAGQILQKHIQTMASDERRLKDMITKSQQVPDHIHFGATRTISEYILPDKLSNLLSMHPNTSITMIVENTSTLIQMLKQGTIDFAFIEGYYTKDDFYHELLSKESFVAVKAPSLALSKEIQSLTDLKSQTLIVREKGSGTREILERALHEQNMLPQEFKNTIEIGNIHAIKQLVKQGHGITFLYEAAVKEELENQTLEIIKLNDVHNSHDFTYITLQNSLFTQLYDSFLNKLKN